MDNDINRIQGMNLTDANIRRQYNEFHRSHATGSADYSIDYSAYTPVVSAIIAPPAIAASAIAASATIASTPADPVSKADARSRKGSRTAKKNDDLSSVIQGIKASYERTNIRDVDLEKMITISPEARIGYLLQNMPNESATIYKVNFDPVENLFLNKLVTDDVLAKRIIIDKDDFFRGLVFLDYLANIVYSSTAILDDIHTMAVQLERKDKSLDPTLVMITSHVGMSYASYAMRRTINPTSIDEGFRRYCSKNKSYEPKYLVLRKVSPLYEALGQMVHSLVRNEEVREMLPEMLNLYDIKAAIFTDAVLDVLHDDNFRQAVLGKMKNRDYYKASLLALNCLSKEISTSMLDKEIQSMMANGKGTGIDGSNPSGSSGYAWRTGGENGRQPAATPFSSRLAGVEKQIEALLKSP